MDILVPSFTLLGQQTYMYMGQKEFQLVQSAVPAEDPSRVSEPNFCIQQAHFLGVKHPRVIFLLTLCFYLVVICKRQWGFSVLCFFFSERISMRQSKVDKLYAGLKDLAEERRGKLDERHRLFQLNREVDDLEQWIAEREVVAGSHELGQDYEHVTVSSLDVAAGLPSFCTQQMSRWSI